MHKAILGIVAIATVASPFAIASSAHADTASIPNIGGTVSLTVNDVRYGASGDCVENPVTVTIDVPDDYSYMSFDFDSTYSGPTSWASQIYDSGSYSGTFTNTFLICPTFDNPGNYTGTVDVHFYDDWYAEIATAHATDAFSVSAYVAPPVVSHTSSLSTSKVKAGSHGWMIRTASRYDARPWGNAQVTLQVKSGGTWRNVKAAWSDSTGRANLTVTPARGRAKYYRVVLSGSRGVSTKVSPTYLLRRR